MRIWTVLTQKGGAAKTTTSLNLAVVAASDPSNKVLVIDCDSKQGSATKWWEQRTADEMAPMVVSIDPADIDSNLEIAKDMKFTHVIIDTPGYAGLTSNTMAERATFCIVPAQPSVMDIKATQPTVGLLNSLKKPFAVLLTRCPPNGSEALEAANSFKALGLVCPTLCTERKAYKRAYATGEGVTELAKYDKTAIAASNEIQNIFDWIVKKEDRLKDNIFKQTEVTA